MKVAFKTFGCRLNRAETAQFESAFAAGGFECVPFGERADVVVFHTCVVTQAAESECLKLIRAQRKSQRQALFVLAGCAAEALSPDALGALGVDLIVARAQKDELPAIVMRHLGLSAEVDSSVPVRTTKRAFLKIQDGCDFFCSYCIVPHTRGAPRSHPFDACLREARAFIDAGFREIVVTGCNIACYRDPAGGLVDLLAALAALPGLGRLRLGSIEPGTVEREVAAWMAETPKACRFLHLPLQSGDNGVLARMGRRYTVEAFTQTLRGIVSLMPDLGLGADIITGFPGESEEAFEHTLKVLEDFPFSNLHVFPYSERPGTPAAQLGGSIPIAERKHRAAVLNGLRIAKRSAFARCFVGKPVEVLVERFDDAGNAHGWTGQYLDCRIERLDRRALKQLVTVVPHASENDVLIACQPV